MNIDDHIKQVERKRAERDLLSQQMLDVRGRLRTTSLAIDRAGASRDVVTDVLSLTQQQVQSYLERVVSSALQTVYGEDYSFELELAIRRNQPEITPWIVRDGTRFSPRDEVGGGVLDVVAIALRLAMWSLRKPRSASVFLLDEPGKFVSQDKQPQFGRMLQELSSTLGIQMIVVSHSNSIIESVSKTYNVTIESGISTVKEVNHE